MLALSVMAAIGLDRWLGEPKCFHPLIGFGRFADRAERLFRLGAPGHPIGNRLRGGLAWSLVVWPFVGIAAWLSHPLGDILLLWLALGGASLTEHAVR